MYRAECPIPGRPGFFSQARMSTPEEQKQALRDAWSTPEQQIFNLMHEQCPTCRGRGYKVYRAKGVLVRERVGCDKCLGLGVVPRTTSPSPSPAGEESSSHEAA